MAGVWLISYIVLWAVVLLVGIVIMALLRGFTGLHQRLEEHANIQGIAQMAPGAALTDQQLPGVSGGDITLSHLWQRGNLLLLFASVDCPSCQRLMKWVGDAYRNGQLSDWDLCVLCAGRQPQVSDFVKRSELPPKIPVAVVEYAALRWRFQIPGTPTIAIVEEHGRVVDVVAGEVLPYLEILTRRSTFHVTA